ncbi:MAG: dethiobiotin synthase [Rhodospirillaceae bacterium]
MSRRGVFVTGTDTGIGKTFVAACLVRAWGAGYWKPVQTGLAEEPGGDSATLARLVDRPGFRPYAPRYQLGAPLSPAAAAVLEGVRIALTDFDIPETDGEPLVVEGAGGVLVPLTDRELIVDLIGRLGLPVILVARSTLGTINHTLLSLEALRARRLPVAGVILNGPPDAGNRAAIERFGAVPVIAVLPRLTAPPGAAAVARLAADRIPPLDTILP